MVRTAAADALHQFGRLDRLGPEFDVVDVTAARQRGETLAQRADRFPQRSLSVSIRT